MPARDVHATSTKNGDRDRYEATIPPPWKTDGEARWELYAANLAIHAEVARNIASYGKALVQCYARGGPPLSATDLRPYAGGIVASDVASRAVWDAASLQCAVDAIEHGPDLLLATTDVTGSARAATFRIHAATGLYEPNVAVPVALDRSEGDHDDESDDAVARVLNTTTKVAKSCDCAAPIVSCDLAVADPLIGRLVGDTQPFAAAVGPDWWQGDITAWGLLPTLLGNSPFELFATQGDHIHNRARPGRRSVELIAMQHQGRSKGLFMVWVPEERRSFFLVRPASYTAVGIQQQMTAAADLALRVATLHDVRPLDALGLERFFARDNADYRWFRHATIVQAVLSFSLTDPARED